MGKNEFKLTSINTESSKKVDAKLKKKYQPLLDEYKQKYFKKIECVECGTTEGVQYDDQSCNEYCWPCLEYYLLQNTTELAESVIPDPEENYER